MHSDDSWFHFPLAAVWMSTLWWLDQIANNEKHITFAIGVIIGLLHIAYLVRKHLHLGKSEKGHDR